MLMLSPTALPHPYGDAVTRAGDVWSDVELAPRSPAACAVWRHAPSPSLPGLRTSSASLRTQRHRALRRRRADDRRRGLNRRVDRARVAAPRHPRHASSSCRPPSTTPTARRKQQSVCHRDDRSAHAPSSGIVSPRRRPGAQMRHNGPDGGAPVDSRAAAAACCGCWWGRSCRRWPRWRCSGSSRTRWRGARSRTSSGGGWEPPPRARRRRCCPSSCARSAPATRTR